MAERLEPREDEGRSSPLPPPLLLEAHLGKANAGVCVCGDGGVKGVVMMCLGLMRVVYMKCSLTPLQRL